MESATCSLVRNRARIKIVDCEHKFDCIKSVNSVTVLLQPNPGWLSLLCAACMIFFLYTGSSGRAVFTDVPARIAELTPMITVVGRQNRSKVIETIQTERNIRLGKYIRNRSHY